MSYTSPIQYNISDTKNNYINSESLISECLEKNIIIDNIIINNVAGTFDIEFSNLVSNEEKNTIDKIISFHEGKKIPLKDETGRERYRTDSQDDHDSSYFTGKSDKINIVSSFTSLDPNTGDGSNTTFFFPHKEVLSFIPPVIRVDGNIVDSEEYSVDYSQYDSDINQVLHFCRGEVTFNTPPGNGSAVEATYAYGTIGDGDSFFLDFGIADQTKTISLSFIDPVHIKSGIIYYKNGKNDSLVNAYINVPVGAYYYNNNEELQNNAGPGEIQISKYVNNIIINGDGEINFTGEARARSIPPFFPLTIEVNNGSSLNLEVWGRLDVHRQRTVIL